MISRDSGTELVEDLKTLGSGLTRRMRKKAIIVQQQQQPPAGLQRDEDSVLGKNELYRKL